MYIVKCGIIHSIILEFLLFFGSLYRATVESLPGAFSLVTAAFAVAELALILASRWIAGRGFKGATAGAVPPPAYED